ncbi:hypothetical protein HAX54_022708, partial [Datura stramonium]|nr:hypothetical protein [Datura stramonium]
FSGTEVTDFSGDRYVSREIIIMSDIERNTQLNDNQVNDKILNTEGLMAPLDFTRTSLTVVQTGSYDPTRIPIHKGGQDYFRKGTVPLMINRITMGLTGKTRNITLNEEDRDAPSHSGYL